MKRYILLGAAVGLLVLAGCSKTSETVTDTTDASSTGEVQSDLLS